MNTPRMTLAELRDSAVLTTARKREIAVARLEEIRKSVPRLLAPDSSTALRESALDTEWVLQLMDVQDLRYKRKLQKQARANDTLTGLVTRLLGYLQQRAQTGDEKELLHMKQTLDRMQTEIAGVDAALDLGDLLRRGGRGGR